VINGGLIQDRGLVARMERGGVDAASIRTDCQSPRRITEEGQDVRRRLQVPVAVNPGPHAGGLELNAEIALNDGDAFQVGDYSLRIYFAPGHIDDQVCLAIEGDNRVIVGDTIFEGGPGKTWSSAGFQTTLETLRSVVLAWPDETICYPGHGPAFRLGDQVPPESRGISFQ